MRKLSYFILLILSLCSCSKKLEVSSVNNKVLKSGGDGKYDLLGYGYDPTTGYIDPTKQIKLQVIDVERLVLEQPGAYGLNEAYSNTIDINGGSDALDWSSKLENKFTGSYTQVFTSSINADVTTKKTINSKYSYATLFMKVILKQMKLYHSIDVLKNYLTTNFINDLNTLPASEIISRYGTHVYTDISVGGKLEVDYKSKTNTTTQTLTVIAGVSVATEKIFSIGHTTTVDQSLTLTNTNVSCKYKTYGGNPGYTIIGTIDASTLSMSLSLNTWSSTITSSNSVIVDIGNNSLIPIYEFVSDAAKAAEIKAATDQYLNQNTVNEVDGSIRGPFNLDGSYDKAISLDYDGDGVKDILFYSPGRGLVCLNYGLKDGTFANVFSSSNGLCTYNFDKTTDQVIALDFNGDGKDDLMCYRPGAGAVYLMSSNGDGSFTLFSKGQGIGGYDFSTSTDRAIALDYNGDGKIDIMCYRPGKGAVFLLKGNGNGTFTKTYGTNGLGGYNFDNALDQAIALDYNGDGYDDIMCYRPGQGSVYILKSNGTETFTAVYTSGSGIGGYNFDKSTDQAIALDYDGDHKDDIMCYRPGAGACYLLRSNGNATFSVPYLANGIAGYDLHDSRDRIISLDYNGDGKSDIIMYRPGEGNAYAASSKGSNGAFVLDYWQD